MRLYRLAVPIVLGLLFSSFCATSARADYTWTLTAPSAGFLATPGGTLAVGGSVGWTFGWDTAVANVQVLLYDAHGHQSSTWADCDAGVQSTSFNGTVAVPLHATGAAVCQVKGYDSSNNYLNTSDAVGGDFLNSGGGGGN